jgi:hypothetical protein
LRTTLPMSSVVSAELSLTALNFAVMDCHSSPKLCRAFSIS